MRKYNKYIFAVFYV